MGDASPLSSLLSRVLRVAAIRRPPRGDEKKATETTGPEQMAGFEQMPHVCHGPWIWAPLLPLCPWSGVCLGSLLPSGSWLPLTLPDGL